MIMLMYNNSSDDDDDYDCSITGALDAVVTVLDLVWTCRGLGRHGKISLVVRKCESKL